MNQGPMEIDPLSTYQYPPYECYPVNAPYDYHVKVEQPLPYQYTDTGYVNNTHNSYQPIVNTQTLPNNDETSKVDDTSNDNNDVKRNVKKGKEKKNGKSNYCSEKITDTNFAFYGCSVCNISYTTLNDLDQHVVVHKDRMTSYRLRLKNQVKKKQLKKEKKRMKKLQKIKKETELDLEIKPEDGYIGNETACEYMNKECDSGAIPNTNNGINSQNNGTIENLHNNVIIDSDTQHNENINSSKKKDKENSKVNDSSNNNCKQDNKDSEELNNLEKIYKCFACKKQFTLSYYLKLHVRSHTDEKPYTCSVCGQSFITASKLGRHNKRIHLAARFQCRICFKIFSRFELLTGHFDKNHPDDKLEGEPYDYNAILPYLKELEEQLKSQEVKDEKPKTEDLWWADVGEPPSATEEPEGIVQVSQDNSKDYSKMEVIVEEFKGDLMEDLKIKEELSCDEGAIETGLEVPGDGADPDDDDEVKDEPFKDDSFSDEDYFPSKTWLSSPRPEASPPGRRRLESGLTCSVCSKRVSSRSYLRVHMRTHTGERPFRCRRCGRGFITSTKMHRHALTHHEEGKTETDAKGEDNPDEEESAGKTKKSSRKKMKSKFSKKTKKEGEKTRKKYQKRPHACEFCHQKFLHLEMLQVHKTCHEGETLVLKCHYCLEPAADAAALREHEATHSGPKPYLCTICGKGYKKKETMVYHKKHHAPDREFVCDVCSKRFNASCKLQKHLLTHRKDKFVLRYECPVCAHMFNTKYHIHMHLGTHQREGLILEENRNEILAMVLQNARKIPKQADAPANLTDIIPSDERSRICNICGEIFHHFYYLEEHLKSHGSKIAIEDTNKEEEKKYICQICNKGFKLHYYLKLHSFTHSKEKPFICQQCGKGFITKGKLKRHLETHTGLKKYQCHICCKFFTRPSYLRIHIRTIHGTQDYNFRFDKGYAMNHLAMPVLTQMSDMSRGSV